MYILIKKIHKKFLNISKVYINKKNNLSFLIIIFNMNNILKIAINSILMLFINICTYTIKLKNINHCSILSFFFYFSLFLCF